ncbi:MAG: DNA polymerase III subunit alpha [Rickettsiales bacterium]|jgi:DNA polymerase-3 subunit alpha|nr:DNA polymerase III subunit alpha [Rickettsiales bacterium]
MTKFIHLRTHSEYSLCSGTIRLKDFVRNLKNNAVPAAAITDSHNMFGVMEYSLAAMKEGIQPIIGCEVVLEANRFLTDDIIINSQSIENIEENFCKIVLLAKTEQGLLNLMSLVSESYLEREINLKPHIKLDDLVKKGEGLIVLSGGVDGVIGKAVAQRRRDRIDSIVEYFSGLFRDDFYLEISRHGLGSEIDLERGFIDVAYRYNIPLVATNDCYFYEKEMFEAQDALSCIANGRYVAETNRPKLTSEHYFKSEEEMLELFRDIPEATENTVAIAKKISAVVHRRAPMLPHFDLPNGVSEVNEIRRASKIGLEERLKHKFLVENITAEDSQSDIRKRYLDQLEFELGVITQMDFAGYFLIVADFIVWSKTHGVPVGPGRGSGAGSVVAWSLKITELDPIKFGLFFERFLNPERVSMPDFDIDFCQRGRAKTIEYVQNKYGKDKVAQIITFGKLQSRAVVKDVGRVLEMSYGEVDRISKMIPFNATLSEALEMDADLRAKRQSDPEILRLFDIAMQLEGLNRHSSVHAAGIVIAGKSLEQICPLYFDKYADMPVVQYDKKYCEEAGLVKFDFLGLKTLTVINDAVNFIEWARGLKIDVDNLALEDHRTFELLRNADSLGVFQVESSGMIGMLKQIKPDSIEDIIALISLYRPGPMDNIPTYIRRKHGLEKIEYMHPKMEPILKDTYGIIIYQEQVMDIAKSLAGYTLGAADILRKAMGKKIREEMDQQKDVFISGCKVHSDIDCRTSGEIFDLLAKFAEYGFNKAHSAAYAIVSYQTAYLKAHYPVEFMAATLNMEIMNTDKINYYLQDIKKHAIKVLPPDINLSDAFFRVELVNADDGERKNRGKEYYHKDRELAIRYGLCAIKGVGQDMMRDLMEERAKNGRFVDIFDFCRRIGSKIVNKKTMDSLSKSGSFDCIHDNRRQIYDSFETLASYAKIVEDEKNSPQISLFDCSSSNIKLLPKLVSSDDWIGHERFQGEFEAFGFYFGNHPLDTLKQELASKGIVFFDEMGDDIDDNSIVRMAGVIISTSVRSGDRGRYAYISLSDPTGMVEVSIFNSDMITQNKDLIDDSRHSHVVFECSVRRDDSGIRINARDLWPLDQYLKNTKSGLKKFGRAKKKNENQSNFGESRKVADKKEAPSRRNIFAKKISIFISNEKCVDELSGIIKQTKIDDVSKCPEINIIVAGKTIRLPKEFCLRELEIKRIRETYGVDRVESTMVETASEL